MKYIVTGGIVLVVVSMLFVSAKDFIEQIFKQKDQK